MVASREATVKALRRLRDAGLIETSRGRIRVLGLAGLAKAADGGGPPRRDLDP